jgi:predicted nuclease of predicted toxin-antitoxin system
LKFLVDAQLPPALARALSSLGHDAVHVADIQLHTARDFTIWKEAVRRGAVILTKDEDFVGQGRFAEPVPAVVWVRFGNMSRRTLLTYLLPLLPQVVRLIEAGEKIVEVRGP